MMRRRTSREGSYGWDCGCEASSLGRLRPPPVDTTAHVVHLVLPPAHAVMVPAPHSSSPYHESEDGEAQRPPPDKTENHQRDPGWLSKLIDPCCDRHGGVSL